MCSPKIGEDLDEEDEVSDRIDDTSDEEEYDVLTLAVCKVS